MLHYLIKKPELQQIFGIQERFMEPVFSRILKDDYLNKDSGGTLPGTFLFLYFHLELRK